MRSFLVISMLCIVFPVIATATDKPAQGKNGTDFSEMEWGVAMTVRSASIAYDTSDDTVHSVVPMLFYKGDRFFLEGLGGGVTLYNEDEWRFDLLGRMRFVDIPRDFQNEIQADTIDLGARLSYSPYQDFTTDFELLSDDHARIYANINFRYIYEDDGMELSPFAILRFTSDDYNSYYYGLDREELGWGSEVAFGMSGRYHLYRNLYAIGKLQATWLGDEASSSPYVDNEAVYEMYLGVGFFNEPKTEKRNSLSSLPYLRVAHGWATPSNMGDIFAGDSESDSYNNQMTSIFYGHPLADELFGIPMSIYLTTGIAWHWEGEVQNSIQEYVMAIKAYYTFDWPVTWRVGFAEGLSYVSDITYIEESEMEEKGYEPSELMNYLDVSIDVELGSLLRSESLKNWYLGYSLHHRSGIFESASQFGRIKGGSNYNTIYLQHHF